MGGGTRVGNDEVVSWDGVAHSIKGPKQLTESDRECELFLVSPYDPTPVSAKVRGGLAAYIRMIAGDDGVTPQEACREAIRQSIRVDIARDAEVGGGRSSMVLVAIPVEIYVECKHCGQELEAKAEGTTLYVHSCPRCASFRAMDGRGDSPQHVADLESACPFCGGAANIVIRHLPDSVPMYYGLCRSCAATGPWDKTAIGARNGWTERSKET